MGHGTGYRQIFDGGVHHIAEQTAVLVAVVDIQTGDGMAVAVKCARVGEINSGTIIFRSISNANRRPFLIFQINVRYQHGADFGFFFGFCIVHLIPEPFQPRGGVDLIGVCHRAAAGDESGVAGDSAVIEDCAGKNTAGDGAVIGDCAVKNAAGDGSVVDDLAVECAAFDGAAGGDGHLAFEHSPASACNGTGIVFVISQHDVAFNRAAVGVKNPIARLLRAGDV